DRNAAAERFGAGLEPVAHLAIEVGQREPADAAFRIAADRGSLHQLVPQALGIDTKVVHAGSAITARRLRRADARSRTPRRQISDRSRRAWAPPPRASAAASRARVGRSSAR